MAQLFDPKNDFVFKKIFGLIRIQINFQCVFLFLIPLSLSCFKVTSRQFRTVTMIPIIFSDLVHPDKPIAYLEVENGENLRLLYEASVQN
ncbi:hypothetical protein GCM10008018_70600 [Paenibacillus marchantiophytorum]|uniref:Uncharacterized protein n=1 Tax=Paenibacillus marchantiophytorum TaxID=1619310 RepID=A0ABQ1FJC2_9BACL|nr:hypothetical protein GCM10008018_70600 [Paenibacillus marchantiophytorum]